MARTAELILRLVDQVTKPARGIAQSLSGLNRAADAVSTMGRNMRRSTVDMAGISVPLIALGSEAARQVYALEKASNAAMPSSGTLSV